MADPLKTLRDKQARLLQEAQEVEKDLREFERIAKKHGIKIDTDAGELDQQLRPQTKPAPRPAATYRSKKAQIEGEARAYLVRKGGRAPSGEIAKALLAQGVGLGKTPGKTLSAYLARSPGFDNVPAAGGYGLVQSAQPNLADRELPLAS
jgi:hypothetical protein